jgi:hypothetical protein
MAKWRKKLMALDDWAPFQDKFADLQMAFAAQHEDFAMFSKGHPADELTEIYITSPNNDLVERLSPGGWEDSEPPSGERVILLVASNDAWERFGIPRPDARNA